MTLKKIAMVISPGDEAVLEIKEMSVGEMAVALEEEGFQPEVVVYSDPSVNWQEYVLIWPTVAFSYATQYQAFIEVRLFQLF